MTNPDPHDGPFSKLRYKLGRRHAQLGIQILDHTTGQEVATVQPHEHALLVANLFANAPSLFYGIARARVHLRQLIQREGFVEPPELRALRTLLKDLEETTTAAAEGGPPLQRFPVPRTNNQTRG